MSERSPGQAVEAAAESYGASLDAYAQSHAAAVKRDPTLAERGRARRVASWELSGLCLKRAYTLVVLLERGHGFSAYPAIRSLHEASAVLTVVSASSEADLLARWLDGESLPHSTAARAVSRVERSMIDSAGLDDAPVVRGYWEALYARMSEHAHPTRVAASRYVGSGSYSYRPSKGSLENQIATVVGGAMTMKALEAIDLSLPSLDDEDRILRQAALSDLKGAIRSVIETLSALLNTEKATAVEGFTRGHET